MKIQNQNFYYFKRREEKKKRRGKKRRRDKELEPPVGFVPELRLMESSFTRLFRRQLLLPFPAEVKCRRRLRLAGCASLRLVPSENTDKPFK